CHLVKRSPQFVKIARLGLVNLTNIDATIPFQLHQTGLFKGPESFADRRPTNSKASRELELAQLVARSKLTRGDEAHDLFAHERRHGSGLEAELRHALFLTGISSH